MARRNEPRGVASRKHDAELRPLRIGQQITWNARNTAHEDLQASIGRIKVETSDDR